MDIEEDKMKEKKDKRICKLETKKQKDTLTEYGCDIIQGYLYAKPMPGDRYHDLIDFFSVFLKRLKS